MADEVVEKEKKHILPNTPQTMALGGIVAAIMVLQPVKDWFFTRDEGVAIVNRVTAVEISHKEFQAEMRGEMKSIRTEIKDSHATLKNEFKEGMAAMMTRQNEMIDRTIGLIRAEGAALSAQIKELKDDRKSKR